MDGRYIDELRGLPADELAPYLTARSGLPGPRANLALADALAAIADHAAILLFAAVDDEYLRFCGTEAIGRLIVGAPDDASFSELIRQRAGDDLWRVREGAARALQIVGDVDLSRLRTSWPNGSATRTPMCAALPWQRSASRGCWPIHPLGRPRCMRATERPSRSPRFPRLNARPRVCGICVRHLAIAGASRSPLARVRECPPSKDCGPPTIPTSVGSSRQTSRNPGFGAIWSGKRIGTGRGQR